MEAEPIWGFELFKLIRDVWLSRVQLSGTRSSTEPAEIKPELGELCWSLKLKGNLNIFKKLFQLNMDNL